MNVWEPLWKHKVLYQFKELFPYCQQYYLIQEEFLLIIDMKHKIWLIGKI